MSLNKLVTIKGVPVYGLSPALVFQNLFGELGPEHFLTLHWTAGVIDRNLGHCEELIRQYHRDHTFGARLRAGGIAYHFCLPRVGGIILLRPVVLKGAHTGGANSNNVGVMTHGGAPGHKLPPSDAQLEAFLVLLRHAHKPEFPAKGRTDRPLKRPYTKRLGHNDWPSQPTECPGTMRPLLSLRTR